MFYSEDIQWENGWLFLAYWKNNRDHLDVYQSDEDRRLTGIFPVVRSSCHCLAYIRSWFTMELVAGIIQSAVAVLVRQRGIRSREAHVSRLHLNGNWAAYTTNIKHCWPVLIYCALVFNQHRQLTKRAISFTHAVPRMFCCTSDPSEWNSLSEEIVNNRTLWTSE